MSQRKCQRAWQRVLLVVSAVAITATMAYGQPHGDVTCDGAARPDDAAALLFVLFSDPPTDCAAADVNGDGAISAGDVIAVLQTLDPPPPTPVPEGPLITFFGLAGADGTATNALGEIDGAPVYFRNSGFGFKIVVEGKAGVSGLPPETTTANADPHDPSRRPDLQIESSTPLGNGDSTACNGGVPAIDPPDFGPGQLVANALNAFACLFGSATSPNFACTQDQFGGTNFLGGGSVVQFCLSVEQSSLFPEEETVLSVRLRDAIGNLGPMRQVRLRIGPGPVPPTFSPTATLTPFVPRPTATPSRTATFTPAASDTATATHPSAVAVTSTPTRTPTARLGSTTSPTPTPTLPTPRGPVITFFGITRADDTLVPADTSTGLTVYARAPGAVFNLVIEGQPGASRLPVGTSSYQADLSDFPDLQVEVSQPLGSGSPDVCDNSGPMPGGVPPTEPANFDATPININTVNDLACRFVDGSNMPKGRSSIDGCVKLLPSEEYGFVCNGSSTDCPSGTARSTIQYCAFIGSALEFQPGDTVVTARLRDTGGNVGPPARIVIRIGAP